MLSCASCGPENRNGARFCDDCGRSLLRRLWRPARPAVAERRTLATLLFCDMSGSTAMGERVDAESVRDMVFRYFHTMRAAIERRDGTAERFIGDAVVALLPAFSGARGRLVPSWVGEQFSDEAPRGVDAR